MEALPSEHGDFDDPEMSAALGARLDFPDGDFDNEKSAPTPSSKTSATQNSKRKDLGDHEDKMPVTPPKKPKVTNEKPSEKKETSTLSSITKRTTLSA